MPKKQANQSPAIRNI